MSRVLILGAGISGLAAGRLARSKGLAVTLYDEGDGADAIADGFSIATGTWDSGLLTGVDLVVASPGFSERSAPIVESMEYGVDIWSEIEFAWSYLSSPVIAVTGTNGKTSVTEATSQMLDASGLDAPATGNIGSPLSDYADTTYDALVVEVSSFQLRFCEEFHPVAAAITNVAADHLDWHGSEQAYRAAKARIYRNQDSHDLLVYNVDDPGAVELALASHSELFPVSGSGRPSRGGGVDEGRLVVRDMMVDLADLTSTDTTHVANLATASALALWIGASREGIVKAARRYQPGAHRRSLVLETSGVSWVNDSKATNPHSALASIRSRASVILIAGGLAKGLDISPLGTEPNLKLVIGIGEAGPVVVDAAGDLGRLAGSLEVAVEVAAQAAGPGDTVLLAPGCASFDQFEDYAERGRRFEELVRESQGGAST